MKKIAVLYLLLVCSGVYVFGKEMKHVDSPVVLKQKKELLKLHIKLVDLQLEYQEEREDYEELDLEVKKYERLADRAMQGYESETSEKTRKALKKAEKANKKLAKVLESIKDIEEDLYKLQTKIEEKNYVVEINRR